MGALIVLGDEPEVLNICSGGFLLDAEFTPQRLSELAKMDGAIILASDGTRVARANVHLVPDPDIPTTETGTRHRTAERVAPDRGAGVHGVRGDGCRVRALPRAQAHARGNPARAGARRSGAPDPRALQGAPRRRHRRAVGPRSRGPRHAPRRRHRAPAGRDGAPHRRRDRGIRRRARRRRSSRRAAARGAHRRGRGRPPARRPRLLRRVRSTGRSKS